ncbi:MAG TPA: hypothetical protein VJN18_14665 [Polyangiaceae bacterium]|nr:hypothetical protein [Polyangiaceae bacterium]
MATEETEITREQLEAEAEALAREVLGVSAEEAWRRVRDERLHEGTFFATRLAEIHFLLGDPGAHYPAAAE